MAEGARLGLLVALACLAPRGAAAFECKRSDIEPFAVLRWPERQVRLGVAAGRGVELSAVRGAAGAWSGVGCSDLQVELLGVVPQDRLPAAGVAFVDAGWARGDDGAARPLDAVGLTTTVFDRFTGEIVSALVEVNRERFLVRSDPRCAVGEDRAYDLQSVLTHELGHLLGFDHTRELAGDASDPTMAPTIGPCEADKRSLEADDRAGLCALYPRGRGGGVCVASSSELGALRGDAVDNAAFGCRGAGPGPGPWGLFALVWALSLARRRPCSRPRSAR